MKTNKLQKERTKKEIKIFVINRLFRRRIRNNNRN